MKKIVSLTFILGLFSIIASANVRLPNSPTPKPNSNPSIETNLRVEIRRDITEAKLIIPKGQLRQLRAELDNTDDSDGTFAFSIGKTQTVISGVFLSLAFVLGGVWLVRSRKADTKASKALVVGGVLFLSGIVGTIVYANVGPPPEARSLTGKFFSQEVNLQKFGSGKIKLEVSNRETSPILLVPDLP